MLHEKLGLKGNTQRTKEANERAALLRQRIRTSEITVTVHGSERHCIPAAGVPRGDYSFTGSGIVFYDQMLIERFDTGDIESIHQEIASNGTSSKFVGRGLDIETGEYDAEEIAKAIERGDFSDTSV